MKFNLKNVLGILFLFIISIILFNSFIKDSTKSRYYNDLKKLIIPDQPNIIETLKLTPWGLHYNAGVLMVLENQYLEMAINPLELNVKIMKLKKYAKLRK